MRYDPAQVHIEASIRAARLSPNLQGQRCDLLCVMLYPVPFGGDAVPPIYVDCEFSPRIGPRR